MKSLQKEVVLETKNLSKSYRGVPALKEVSITLEKGKIYGFIGPNGAGKTTLMRLITGLTKPSGGSFSLFGAQNRRDIEAQRTRIGAIVERPALNERMTARQNLKVLAICRGIKNEEAIDRVLEIVKLSDTGKKRVGKFSLGMKQRLGLAMALINDPEFLLLDEPNIGLDPMGIREMREFLLTLNKEQGTTILISSHILTELYQLADEFIIINHGEIMKRISHEELKKEDNNLEDYFLNILGGHKND